MAATLIVLLAVARLAAAPEPPQEASQPSISDSLAVLVDELYAPAMTSAAVLDVAARARPLTAQADDRTALLIEFELANAALHVGDVAQAGEWLAASRPRWPTDLGLLALAIEQAMATRSWETARALLAEGRRLEESEAGTSDPVGRGMVDLEAILFEVRLGRTDRALLLVDELLKRPGLDPSLEAAALARKVDLYLMAGRADAALEVADEIPDDRRSPDVAIAQLIARAWLPGAAGDVALREELAAAASGSPASFGPRLLARLAATDLALAAGDLARADEALAQIARDLPPSAEATDRLRERQWAGSLAARRARLGGAPRGDAQVVARAAFDALLREWRASPLLPGGLSLLRSEARRAVVHEAIVTADDDAAGLGLLLAAQAMGSLARRLDLAAPTPAEVRAELLGRGQLLLEWLPTRDVVHLFLVDATSVRRIETTVDRPLPPEAIAALRRARHAWLVGADLLERGDPADWDLAPGEPLGATVAYAELPSVPVALWLRRRPHAERPAAIDSWIGPAASLDGRARFALDRDDFASKLATLRWIDGGASGDAASLLAALRGDVGLLIAHGVVDRKRDRFAGLLLGRSGDPATAVAWADAFEAAPLPPFVALAACSAGEAPNRVGEDGGEHLGGAALLGGARCVLIGRGELDAATAIPLLAATLRAIEAGASPAEALLDARRRPDAKRPFDRLALVGLGDEPLRQATPRSGGSDGDTGRRRLLGGAIALLGVGLLLITRRARDSRARRG